MNTNDDEGIVRRARKPPGRVPGTLNKLSQKAIEQARETGILPHEILLSMARGEPQAVYKVTEEGGLAISHYEVLDVDQRRDAAKGAAPYYAPRISTVELVSGMKDDDLDSIIASLATQAGVDPSALGARSTQQAQPDAAGRTRRRYEDDEE